MYSCHNTAVFIQVARAARGLQVPTLRWPEDGRKWSAGKSKDIFVNQREEDQNGGFSPKSVFNYLEIWLRDPASIYVAFSRGLPEKKKLFTETMYRRKRSVCSRASKCTTIVLGTSVILNF